MFQKRPSKNQSIQSQNQVKQALNCSMPNKAEDTLDKAFALVQGIHRSNMSL
jgi:hypothetical protein